MSDVITESERMLPRIGEQTALERRMAVRLLKVNPGLAEKSYEIANTLADSGLSPTAATMLMLAVYSPTETSGKGQGTRLKWFMEAVTSRYSHKLDKIKNDPKQFRTLVADFEEATEMRDILNGEGVTISFQAAFLLWELGLDANSIMGTIQEVMDSAAFKSNGMAAKFIVRAAQAVKAGHFITLEAAIESMRYGYGY